MLDEQTITRAIIERFTAKLLAHLDVDVAVCGGGPSGLVAAWELARRGRKVALFERRLSLGGGMWGGGMMFNQIVVQEEGKALLDDLGIAAVPYADGYFTADAIEAVAACCLAAARAGAALFNLVSVEDLLVRENEVCGVVINWTAVEQASLHVDPLTVRAKAVIDATGHPAEVVRTLERKMGVRLETPTGQVLGERSLWADKAESTTLANTGRVFPGLWVAGMSANAVFGSYRMGPVFGGMLLSGRKVAELVDGELTACSRDRGPSE
ncbi:MAG: thiazole biosynthesis protein [Thermoleophilia bacterium]|nr:thiazole biosynthesis protein [Thermoleophilia bacterium]